MTEKRYGMSNETGAFIDKQINKEYTDDEIIDLLNEQYETITQLRRELSDYTCTIKQLQEKVEIKEILLKELYDENEQLKKELLFFYDVANCECSTNWRKDMEKGCKRFFNCTYEEAKEKYGDYDGMWWEIND